tara:strand:+ start:60 stop:515 length:456 start_codon:yes stop_codon:yes gene_type:complete
MLKYNLSQLDSISKKISSSLSETDCIFLYGELGSGKTTFVRSLIHQLQKKNNIKKTEVVSPTFNILYEYEIKSLKIMHYDLYRLQKNKDLNKLGMFQANDTGIRIIEWPGIVTKTIENRLEITFYHQKEPESRKLKIKGYGKWKKFKLNAI